MVADLVVFALKLTVVDFEVHREGATVEPFADRTETSADLSTPPSASGPTRASDARRGPTGTILTTVKDPYRVHLLVGATGPLGRECWACDVCGRCRLHAVCGSGDLAASGATAVAAPSRAATNWRRVPGTPQRFASVIGTRSSIVKRLRRSGKNGRWSPNITNRGNWRAVRQGCKPRRWHPDQYRFDEHEGW